MDIEVILSPDLQLQERRQERLAARLAAAKAWKMGAKVKAGPNGHPGILESISPQGFAAIRWEDGSLLCGIEADELVPA